MKNKFLIFLVFLCANFTEAQSTYKTNLDSLFDTIENKNKAMGSISVFKNGKEIYSKFIGFSNKKSRKIANKNTKYRIGSITKTFTATIILQLIDEEKLTLNTTINEFFPKIPNAAKISIEDLLRHESGLANVTEDKNIASWITKPQTREQMIDRFIKNGVDFEPKEKSKYSNTNFIILSYITELIDKKSFAEILETRIIKPINLKRTEFGKTITVENNEALAYFFKNNTWNLIDMQTEMSAPMGAGAIVSSAKELNVFFYNLFTEKLTSTSALKNLMTIKKGNGLGIMQFNYKGLKVYGHDGGIDGFQSFALHIPNKNITMAFTFNGLTTQIMPLVISILDTYFKTDTSLKSESSIQLKSEDLNKYLGIYSGATFPAKVTFTKKENILFAEATGQPIFKLVAFKKDIFKYDSMGIIFSFNLKKEIMTINFGGKEHTLKKE